MRKRGALVLVLTLAGPLDPVRAEDVAPGAATEAEAAPAEPAPVEAAPAQPVAAEASLEEEPDYDPWQSFNERMFSFNFDVLDRRIMKPVSRGWDRALPDQLQWGLDNAFANFEMPRRFVNHLLQARPVAAGKEFGRFLVNSTAGVAGFIDVADRIGLHGRDADTGQTLGVWGFGQGPYLMLPFMPPLTVRDGIGYGFDGALDPLGYIVPIPIAASLSITGVRRVNTRSLQPAVFENVEETVIDLYSSVRNAYLQRRRRAVLEGRADSIFSREPRPAASPDGTP
jgi:phospholipid-binding lipoprotein MlaA